MSTSLNNTQVDVYFVTIATAVAHHRQTAISPICPNFPDVALTNIKFPDFSRFFRREGGHLSSSRRKVKG